VKLRVVKWFPQRLAHKSAIDAHNHARGAHRLTVQTKQCQHHFPPIASTAWSPGRVLFLHFLHLGIRSRTWHNSQYAWPLYTVNPTSSSGLTTSGKRALVSMRSKAGRERAYLPTARPPMFWSASVPVSGSRKGHRTQRKRNAVHDTFACRPSPGRLK